jgi:hypothetical protein
VRTKKRLSASALVFLAACAACAKGDDGSGLVGGGDSDAGVPAGNTDAGSLPDASNGPEAAGPDPTSDAGQDVSSPPDATTDGPPGGGTNGDGGDAAPPPPVDAGPAPALSAKWNFDEGSGTSSADLSGNGHTLTFVGGASWATAGKEGTGLALDGTTGYADLGANLIDTTKSFSVLCWAKLAVVNAWEVALSQDDTTGSLFGLKLRGDATNDFDFDVETTDVTNPGFVVAQSTTVAQALTWVHLAGVYDASGAGTLKLYVNGALQASAAINQTLLPSSGHFVIGRGLYNGVKGSFFNGTIDEVEVHAAALTDAQVAAIYGAEM